MSHPHHRTNSESGADSGIGVRGIGIPHRFQALEALSTRNRAHLYPSSQTSFATFLMLFEIAFQFPSTILPWITTASPQLA
jgi:hypothetical protein